MDIETRPDRLAKPTYTLSPFQFQFSPFHSTSTPFLPCDFLCHHHCQVGVLQRVYATASLSIQHPRSRAWHWAYGRCPGAGVLVGRRRICKSKKLALEYCVLPLLYISYREVLFFPDIVDCCREKRRAKIRSNILTGVYNSPIMRLLM